MQDAIFKRENQEIPYCQLFFSDILQALKLTELAESKDARLIILLGEPALYPITIVFNPVDLPQVLVSWLELTGQPLITIQEHE